MNEAIANWNRLLEENRERVSTQRQLERRREQLQTQVNAELKRIVELEVKLDKEQEDVDRLLKLSWTNLFHTLLRSKEEQLETERQEALAVSLKLQQAKLEVDTLKEELVEAGDKLASLRGADEEYTSLMRQKEQWIVHYDAEFARQLGELDERLAEAQLQDKEWYEAAAACRQLVLSLEEAVNKLDSAANWGTYDMLGGGLISTSIKHSKIDDAKVAINTARHLVKRLKEELKDVNLQSDLAVEIGGMSTFADYFFDGLIADWIVQGKIKESLSQAENQLHKARMLLKTLEKESGQAAGPHASLKEERDRLIRQFAG
ncbi:hypothetical protein [Paenibacillus gorillae]|uniref:hypothetical protein n=1 Tax=Paenibacillus gorillae TaxID=1243662 RepID=UPI0004B5CCBC|nr:hypothetical protein [Paenibacillus gorillae]